MSIRSFKQGFPIEWELLSGTRFGWWSPGWEVFVDRLNEAASDLLMVAFHTSQWYLLDSKDSDYRLRTIQTQEPRGILPFVLPDIYLGTTQKKNIEEYWGYRFEQASDKGKIALLRKIVLENDLSGFNREDINISHHVNFLGITFFDIKDIDSDGIDEVLVVERTGKRKIGVDKTFYLDVKDYIQILKWNGIKYQTMWISPAYKKIGTKFIVDDIRNSGKKQLIVLTPHNTIQIWERQ